MTALVFLVLLGLTGAGAEALTLQGAVDRALAQNTGYQTALLAVDRARSSLVDPVNWKGLSVSVTKKQVSDPAGVGAAPGSSTTLGFNAPLFDQLGVSATVDQDRNAQVSLSATPLVHSDTSAQAKIAYDKAVVAAAQARTDLETAVRKAWLAQASAQAQVRVQAQKTTLKETAYHDSRARFDKGQVTLTEVRTALAAWTDAQGTQTTLERTLVQAQSDLAADLGVTTVDLAPLDSAALQALVTALGPVDETVKGTSSSVRGQALEVEAQRAKADAVWALDPGLTVSGSASVPASGTTTWSGSATLTLSLGSWKGSDRSLADRAVDLARQGLVAAQNSALSTETRALLTVKAAASTAESRSLALTQAQELLTETQILNKAGQATALDLDDAQLGVASAQNDVFAAWADLYCARLDLAAVRS